MPAILEAMNVPIGLVLGGGSLLNQVGRELRTAVDAQLGPLGLTSQQASLLTLAARRSTSPAALLDEVGVDTAGMTRLLDRLAAKGLVERVRHPDDRRSVVIELTPAGRALVPHLPPIFGRVTTALLAGFSTPETEQLSAMLLRILANLRDLPTPPTAATEASRGGPRGPRSGPPAPPRS
jgi:DNA-binding MarR family transcriptional regulator